MHNVDPTRQINGRSQRNGHPTPSNASPGPNGAALIELADIRVDIDGATILHDINWRLAPDEHWGVVGANGSGKSTFLALLSGERWPAPGHGTRWYDFGAGPRSDAVEAKRRIAVVSPALQDRYVAFDWNFAALDVVLSGVFRTDVPRQSPSTRDSLRAKTIMRELNLAGLSGRPFLELSRGQQRRVLIARGIAFGARVLLLDEPASGLDQAARRDLDELLAQVAARTQLVITAHSLDQLAPTTTHVLALADGHITDRRAANEPPLAATTPTSPASGKPSDLSAAIAAGAVRDASPTPLRDHRRGRQGFGFRGTDVSETSTNASPPANNKPVAPLHPLPDTVRPVIEVGGADIWLGGRRVLHAINWQLTPGEHWLVTGANGAGKSSFLRLLHGQLRPALGGWINWPGLGHPASVWALRRKVGWFAPELQAAYRYRATVRECVASGFDASLGLVRVLTSFEQARVDQLLERFSLTPLADRLTTSLSYGQFRRALLARVLTPNPNVVLLDEPWEGLDPDTTELLAMQLNEAVAEGVQLVCASHVDGLQPLWTHELVLERGCVTGTFRHAAPSERQRRATGANKPA